MAQNATTGVLTPITQSISIGDDGTVYSTDPNLIVVDDERLLSFIRKHVFLVRPAEEANGSFPESGTAPLVVFNIHGLFSSVRPGATVRPIQEIDEAGNDDDAPIQRSLTGLTL